MFSAFCFNFCVWKIFIFQYRQKVLLENVVIPFKQTFDVKYIPRPWSSSFHRPSVLRPDWVKTLIFRDKKNNFDN